MNNEELILEEQRREIAEALEHRKVIISIQNILNTDDGKVLFKYLLKCFDVIELPEPHLRGEFLADRLGFLRAGNSIFKILAEASPGVAAALLAQIEREKHEDKILQARQNG